jgi:hypothetical protein
MKTYSYRVLCSFELQYSFTKTEVENESDHEVSDMEPTDAALLALSHELQSRIGDGYAISSFEIHCNPDLFLGSEDDA